MGKKSDKKVKSDRINVLRKQYDTFLEEDRKRKERNDYILGRLDNMRYLSAVQARHKPILCGEAMPIPNSGAYLPEQLDRREFHTSPPDHNLNRPTVPTALTPHIDTAKNFSDISTLLKEITKKYILIPKLRTSVVNDYVSALRPQSLPTEPTVPSQQANASNEDWKSKYDILEKLKKNQNEDIYDELYPVKEKQTLSKDDAYDIENYSLKKDIDEYKPQKSGDSYGLQNHNTEHSTKYDHEVAEKDLISDIARAETESQNIEAPKVSDNKDQERAVDQTPNISSSEYTNPMNTAFDYKSQNQNIDDFVQVEEAQDPKNIESQSSYHSNYSNENVAAPEYKDDQYTHHTENKLNDVPHVEQYEQQEQPIEVEGNYPDPKNKYLDPDDYSPIQAPETPEQIHIEPTTDTVPSTNNDTKDDEEVYQYPIEMLDVHEFTPADDVQLTDGENLNPKYSAKEDNIEPVVEEPQAEIPNDNQNYMGSEENVQPAYEDEPQPDDAAVADPLYSAGIEAFDAEQREMFYSEETPEYNYDQQQAEAYNQEHPNAPAQDNTYYESPTALEEKEYPVEINEHEESNARYDQNYEQQYGTEYEQYAQPQGYTQSEQQQYYGQADQPYQDYEYQQPDNDTVQNVQQALDYEAGYVDPQNYQATEEMQPAAAQ